MALAAVVGGAVLWQSVSELHAKPPSKETVLFDVTAPKFVDGDMQIPNAVHILRVVGDEENTYVAEGRSGNQNQVIVNRPTPVVQLPYLSTLNPIDYPDYFPVDFEYGVTIDIVVSQKNGSSPVMRIFFYYPGLEEGTVINYRLEGEAVITGEGFPTGDSAYTVEVSNLYLSVETGKRKNGIQGPVPGTAIIYLDRVTE